MSRKRKRTERTQPTQDLVEVVGDVAGAGRLESARAAMRLLRGELRATQEELGRALDVRGLMEEAARAIPAPPKWRGQRGRGKPRVSLLALLGDLHIGEVTSPRETEEWGRYNHAIAEARVGRYVAALLRWVRVLRAGYRMDAADVVVLGDLISGDIHEELMRSNEFPPPVQAIAAGRLVAGFASALAGAFGEVRVYGVSGSNHSRLTRGYQFKGGTLNSFDFVGMEYARALLRGHGNVGVEVLGAKKMVQRIRGYDFLVGHGDQVRAWMGIPWYGIERDLRREAVRRLARIQEQIRRSAPVSGGMDYGLGGHWHAPFVGPSMRYLINGSLSGTNEYDHSAGRHAQPQQVAALLSMNHGLFAPIMFRLDDDSDAALEGRDSLAGILGGEADG